MKKHCLILIAFFIFLFSISVDINASDNYLVQQLKIENNYSIENKLNEFDNLIKQNSKNFSENFFDDYKKNIIFYDMPILIKKIDIVNIKLKGNFNNKILTNFTNKTGEDIKKNNEFTNLIKSYDKYKSADNKANFVQLQYVVNDYRIKNSFNTKKVINTIEGKKIKLAYLTFDDGPSKKSMAIVDILNKNKVKGTFFVIGSEVNKKKNHQYLNYIIDNDHTIGIHGYTHIYKKTSKRKTFEKELQKSKKQLQEKFEYSTKLVRSPYGSLSLKKKDIKYYLDEGYYLWDWNVDTLDWKNKKKTKKVNKNIKKQLTEINYKKDVVILYHEYSSSIDTLEKTIHTLKEKGYHLTNMHPLYFYSNYFSNPID